MEIKMNPKMKERLSESKNKNIAILQEHFNELLLPKFGEEYGCISLVRDDDVEIERSEEEFLTFIKENYRYKTEYEACITEIGMNYYFDEDICDVCDMLKATLVVIQVWGRELKLRYPNDQFCFIVQCDMEYDVITMRFHKVREDEYLWVMEEWMREGVQPTAYMIV